MRHLSKSLLVCFVATAAFAQNHPMPGAVSDPPVICTGCPGTNGAGEPNADKPTFPFDTPLQLHAGRYVDSSNTLTVQNVGMRTVRAGLVKAYPGSNRLYLGMSATLGAYDLNTFFTGKLREPMVPVNTIPTGSPYGGRNPFEKLARPDRFFYPEASGITWNTTEQDGNQRITDFDVDDRGYVYLATDNWGWGVISDPGGTDGSLLPSVMQHYTGVWQDNQVEALASFKIGSSYYAYMTSIGPAKLFDVTTPTAPVSLGSRTGFFEYSKYEAGQRIALVGTDQRLYVYTYEALVNNAAPLLMLLPQGGRNFFDVSFDDDGNVWVAELNMAPAPATSVLKKLTPSGSSYTTTSYDVYGLGFRPFVIHASAGYIAVSGNTFDGATNPHDLRLLKIVGGVPQLVETNFFRNYYHHAPAGYAQAGPFADQTGQVQIVAQGQKTYLFYSSSGLGDVFELGEGPRITSMTPRSGIPAGGTNVSIYATGLAAGATVTFGGVLASSSLVSGTQIDATSPMHASGAVDVVVSVPAQPSMTSPWQFTYLLAVPQQFVATATSTDSVSMSWSAVTGATHYEVSRRSPDGNWLVIGSPSGTSFTDGGRAAETTYVYRVRSADASNFSSYSATDVATTDSTESHVIAPGMTIRAAHMIYARNRVNAFRAAAGLSAYVYSNAVSGTVKAVDVNELRTAFATARLANGLTGSVWFTDSITPAVRIKAVHLDEILQALK